MTETLYLRPLPLIGARAEATGQLSLAGGAVGFAACELVLRRGPAITQREVLAPVDLSARLGVLAPAQVEPARALLDRITGARPPFAGLALDRPRIMGVINVTPDSFSDGGDRFEPGRAIADGLAMIAAGADLLDIGGESTRPGAEPVSEAEELGRVVPVIAGLAGRGAVLTIDTRHASVMAGALRAGAEGVNDVTALTGDREALAVVAEAGVPVVLMHMQGDPRSMQRDPRYHDAALDIYDYLAERVAACEAGGIPRARIAVDPGIGFGKNDQHNLRILAQLAVLHGLGCPIVLGVSRKSFIGRLSRGEAPKARLPGSLAGALAGLARGAQIIRVHDVAETRQALAIWQAITLGGPP